MASMAEAERPVTDESAERRPSERVFFRVFLPGLVLGLVVGAFGGAVLPSLLGGRPTPVPPLGGGSEWTSAPADADARRGERDERGQRPADSTPAPADGAEPVDEPVMPPTQPPAQTPQEDAASPAGEGQQPR